MEEMTLDAYPALPIAINVEPECPETAVKVFEWKLLKTAWTKSIFNKKKMKERIDINLIYGFIKSEMGIAYQGCSRYDGIPCEIKTELDQIKYLRNQYDKKQKIIKMAHCLPKHKWGRTIPIGYSSLSVLHRPTRHRLSTQEYIDIDIVNCQPQLIQEICRQRGIKVEALEKYCKNPKKYRAFVAEYHDCDKDTAKQLFVRLMFGGTYAKWIKDFDIQKNENNRYKLPHDIEGEMGAVIDAVYTANPHIAKDVLKQNPKKWVNEGEKKRGVMGLWSQTLERRIMEDSVWFLHDNKQFVVEDVVPCQDGLMILKDLYYDDILTDLGRNILDKYGFNIEFVVKPFDEAIEIPTFEDVKSYDEWIDCLSSKRLADHLVVMKGDFIVSNDDGVFVFYNGRWYNETDEKKRNRLTLFVSEDLYEDRKTPIQDAVELSEDEAEGLLKTLRTNTSNGAIFKDIIRHTLSKQVGKFEGLKFDERKDLLGFTNGVLELPTGNFRPYDYNDYITLTTLYDYHPPDYTNNEVVKLKKDIEDLMMSIQDKPDHLELLYQILCSGLDGNLYQKFFFFNGKGGNGKGLISGLMHFILGVNFCISPKEIVLKGLKSGGATPEIAGLQHKRYLIFTEMGGSIDNNAFKKLTGNDSFEGRGLYKDDNIFKLHATNVGEFNNPPDFDEALTGGEARRALDVGFNNNFTDDPEKIDQTINGVFYKKANPYYTTDDFIRKASPILLDILLEKYRKYYSETTKQIEFVIPEDVVRKTKALMDGMNIFNKIVVSNWDKVSEVVPDTPFKTLWNEVQYSEDYKALKAKVKRQYSRDKFYEWLRNNYNWNVIPDGMVYVITGIRKRYSQEDIDEVS
jgi:hypothetical protein